MSTISLLIEVIQFVLLCVSNMFWETYYFIFQNRPKKDIKNAHILITGSGHGLGKLLAKKLANSGNTLHLVDINSTLNDENVAELTSDECKVFTYYCDVSKLESIKAMKEEVFTNCSQIDYLFNNAGIMMGKLFTEKSIDKLHLEMNINAMGPIYITKLFIDGMIEKGGHLIYSCSYSGLAGVSFLSTYTASKHAITGFTRALASDLDYLGASNVKLTTIFPVPVDTGLSNGATIKLPSLFPLLKADYVADQMICATREEREELILPRASNYVLLCPVLAKMKITRALAAVCGSDMMKTLKPNHGY